MLEIVADISDNEQIVLVHDPAEAQCELGAPDAPG